MSLEVQCDACSSQYRISEKLVGKKILCKNCDAVIPVQIEEPIAEPSSSSRFFPHGFEWPLFVAFLWFFIGLTLTLAYPWLSSFPSRFLSGIGVVMVLITVVLIAWNLVIGIRKVFRSGRVLTALPGTVAQLFLFPLLFFQISTVIPGNHFHFDHAQTAPDWMLFTLMHAFRALDLPDLLLALGLHVQSIQHQGFLMVFVLLCFHFILDLFLVGLLWDLVRRWKRPRPSAKNEEEVLLQWKRIQFKLTKSWVSAFGILAIIWFWFAFFSGWSWTDAFFWQVDNLIRVVDFADILQLTHVQLHSLHGVVTGLFAILFRVLYTIAILDVITMAHQKVSLRWLNGLGMDKEELKQIAKQHSDPLLRERAKLRLKSINRTHQGEQTPLRPDRWLPMTAWISVGATAAISLFISLFLGNWEQRAEQLARQAVLPSDPKAELALSTLKQMGKSAESAVPILQAEMPNLPENTQLAVIDTLGHFGEKAIPTLQQYALLKDEAKAMRAMKALAQVGPESTLMLVQLAETAPLVPVRELSSKRVKEFGSTGAQILLDHLTEENTSVFLTYLDQLDANWHQLSSDNPLAQRVRKLQTVLSVLEDSGASDNAVFHALEDLQELDPKSVLSKLPTLINIFLNEKFNIYPRRTANDQLLKVYLSSIQISDEKWNVQGEVVAIFSTVCTTEEGIQHFIQTLKNMGKSQEMMNGLLAGFTAEMNRYLSRVNTPSKEDQQATQVAAWGKLLGYLKPTDNPAVFELVTLLERHRTLLTQKVSMKIVEILDRIGSSTAPVVPRLQRLLRKRGDNSPIGLRQLIHKLTTQIRNR